MTIIKIIKAVWFVLRQPRLAPREPLLHTGHLETHDGIPVAHLRGSAYERGFQHGMLLKKDLQRFRATAWEYAPRTAQERLGVPFWIARILTKPLLLVLSALYLPTIASSARAEMQGLADGSGVPLREVVVQTVIWEVFAIFPSKPQHCSEFAFGPGLTHAGSLFGYNYDLIVAADRTVVDTFLAVFVVEPIDAPAGYVAPNTIGSVGLNTAMNDHGVTFGWDNSYLNAKAQKGQSTTPYMVLLRDIALQATTIDNAVRRLCQETRTEADISVLADTKTVGAVEIAGTHSAYRHGDTAWSCNRLQDLRDLDYLGTGRPFDARSERYPILMNQAANHAPVTVTDCVAILRDQGAPEGRQIASSNTAFSATGERYPTDDIL